MNTYQSFKFGMAQFLGAMTEARLIEAYNLLQASPEAFYRKFTSVPYNFFS